MNEYEYEPGQLIEVRNGAHWVGEGRAYIGPTLGGQIAYEADQYIYKVYPDQIRPAPVTHEITLTLTDKQMEALAERDFPNDGGLRARSFQALIEAAREVGK